MVGGMLVILAALPCASAFSTPVATPLAARVGLGAAGSCMTGAYGGSSGLSKSLVLRVARSPSPLLPPSGRLLRRPAASRRGAAGPVMCGGGGLVASQGLKVALGTLEGIGLSLPHAWFKMLGEPHPYFWAQVLFIASNISYFAVAARILRHRTKDKAHLGALMACVGLISSFFHGAQCAFGASHPVTHAFCLFDTSTAVLTGLFFFFGCGHHVLSLPTVPLIVGWLSAFTLLSHTGPYYTLLHAMWHCTSAYLAYSMVKDHEAQLLQRPKPSLELARSTVELAATVTLRRVPRWGRVAAIAMRDGCVAAACSVRGSLGSARQALSSKKQGIVRKALQSSPLKVR